MAQLPPHMAKPSDLLRPTIAEDDAQVEPAEEPAVVPSLTIAPEEEQAPLKAIRPTT